MNINHLDEIIRNNLSFKVNVFETLNHIFQSIISFYLINYFNTLYSADKEESRISNTN